MKIPTQHLIVRTEVREGTPLAVLYREPECRTEAGQISHDAWEELGSPARVAVDMTVKAEEV